MLKTVKFSLGTVTFKLPDMVEALEWAESMGLDDIEVEEEGAEKVEEAPEEKGKVKIKISDLKSQITYVGSRITEVKAEKDGTPITSWEQLRYFKECFEVTGLIVDAVTVQLGSSEKKS